MPLDANMSGTRDRFCSRGATLLGLHFSYRSPTFPVVNADLRLPVTKKGKKPLRSLRSSGMSFTKSS